MTGGRGKGLKLGRPVYDVCNIFLQKYVNVKYLFIV